MRYQFFTNTPAHVHLFRNAIAELRERDHDVHVLARDDECTLDLLEWYGIPHVVYGSIGDNKLSLFANLPSYYVRIVRETRRFDPDLIFGVGTYAAHAGAISRTPTVVVLDSEPSLDHVLARPFVRAILTPEAFRKDLGSRHYVFDGFKECAYLHPEEYERDSGVRSALDLDADERFALLRFNSFAGHHDVGRSGFSRAERDALIERLADEVTVFVSDEGGAAGVDGLPARPYDAHPALIHDVLAEADLFVADTQTMVTEAALLGTPAVRSNSFVGDADMGNFLELEARGLIRNVGEFDEVLDVTERLVTGDGVRAEWRRKRDAYVAEKVNLTRLITAVAERGGTVDDLDALRQR